jgi:hypothetical protein
MEKQYQEIAFMKEAAQDASKKSCEECFKVTTNKLVLANRELEELRATADAHRNMANFWKHRFESKTLPDGWTMVPIKPTKEMQAACKVAGKLRVWEDMLAAVPDASTMQEEK